MLTWSAISSWFWLIGVALGGGPYSLVMANRAAEPSAFVPVAARAGRPPERRDFCVGMTLSTHREGSGGGPLRQRRHRHGDEINWQSKFSISLNCQLQHTWNPLAGQARNLLIFHRIVHNSEPHGASPLPLPSQRLCHGRAGHLHHLANSNDVGGKEIRAGARRAASTRRVKRGCGGSVWRIAADPARKAARNYELTRFNGALSESMK